MDFIFMLTRDDRTIPESLAVYDAVRDAVEAGVDRLMGGVDAEPILALAARAGVPYHPFPGRPVGHPTRLAGTPEEIAQDCRRSGRASRPSPRPRPRPDAP